MALPTHHRPCAVDEEADQRVRTSAAAGARAFLENHMKTITILTIAALVTGCATHNTGSNWTPLIDTKGGNNAEMQSDLADCQAYARQTADAASAGAAGAVAGALLGALFMAAAGGSGMRNEAAAVGALSGGLGAAGRAETDQRTLISRCMAGRGHRVLN